MGKLRKADKNNAKVDEYDDTFDEDENEDNAEELLQVKSKLNEV